MYKIGDKVETPQFIGIIEKVYESGVKVNGKMFPLKDIKPYRTAHEKLIELGYHVTVDETIWKTYQTEDLRNAIFFNKIKNTVNTNFHYDKVLSNVLTQYLEELEE